MIDTMLDSPATVERFPLSWPDSPSRAVSLAARQCMQDAVAHLQTGEAQEAVVLLSRAIEAAPNFPEAHVFLGIAHALTNNIYPALDALETATELDPESFAAHYSLAQLNFKLRIPQKGYEEAQRALRCPMTLEQRKMLTLLLKEERARDRSGIHRPWFNKPFSRPMLFLAGGGLVTAVIMAALHMH